MTSYLMASRPVRVKRSIRWRTGVDPRVFALKWLDSTTSVVPSHRPRASPMYIRIASDKGAFCRGDESSGMTRVS